jgi:type I restriction enzyme, R subunit
MPNKKSKAIRLSPTSGLNLFRECPRCFWQHFNERVHRPKGPFPSLPGGMDSVLRDYYAKFIGSLPPEIKGKVEGVLVEDRSMIGKRLYYTDEKLDAQLFGMLDECLVDGSVHIPLDFKTRRGAPKDGASEKYYQTQLDTYALLLSAQRLTVSDFAYLVYYFPDAVEDEVTVRIYYEGRLAKIDLDASERPKIDPDFDEVTEGEEQTTKEKLKSKWARLEAMVDSEEHIRLVAEDIVKHFEEREKAIEGKAMIVCMSRRICTELYKELVKLRPDWHDEDDKKGVLKVVMTGSASDPVDWQQHIRNKKRRKGLAEHFKDPETPFQIAIVRDMWLTGFDAPCLHTMYFDKPMHGHSLMQAIARVNRVFKDKPGGLVVDYLGIADQLKKALAQYSEEDREEVLDQEEAVAIMLEKYEVVSAMFHGFNYKRFFKGKAADQLAVIKEAAEHILEQKDGKKRLLQSVTELSRAYALSVPHEKALEIRDDIGFFQTVRAALAKAEPGPAQKTQEELDAAVRQIISQAIVSDDVVDIFAAAGLKKPDISILSEEFLAEVRAMPQRNLAIEMLRRLIDGEIKTRSRRNIVQARSFAEMLEKTIRKYQNRTIEAAQVIAELIELAKDMKAADRRGEEIGLTEDELAFYDALEVNDSAVKVLGDDTLKVIARELVETVHKNATIDWTVRENARARLRTMVKRLLRKYGYPPDKQEKATKMVLQQAEAIANDWAT